MKKLTILLALFLPFTVFSQHNQPCRSAIDVMFSPEYFAPPHVEADASFTPKTAFRLGLNINILPSETPHFVFRSGLRYAQFDFDVKGIFNPIVTHQRHQFFEIPLVFRYYFGLNTWRFYMEAQSGLNLNFSKISGSDINLTAGGALGLEYCMTDNMAIFIQPTLRKPIINSLGTGRNEYNFSTGLEMGIKFRY
jgi:Outer membrane protein beta-barrel domain